jgi:hypothetical protein
LNEIYIHSNETGSSSLVTTHIQIQRRVTILHVFVGSPVKEFKICDLQMGSNVAQDLFSGQAGFATRRVEVFD